MNDPPPNAAFSTVVYTTDAVHDSVMISHGCDVRQSDVSYLAGQALLVDQADLEVQGFHLVHGHLEDPGTLLDQ